MSIEAINWAVRCKLPARDKLVLLAIAHNSDAGHEARPSVPDLVIMTNLCERSIQGALADLRRRLLIDVQVGGGRGITSVYRLKLPCSEVS